MTGFVTTFADEFTGFSPWTGTSGTWMTRFTYGGLASYTLTPNGEEQIYTDANFRGLPGSLSSEPLGLNPFEIQDGKLVITARPIPDSAAPYTGGYGWSSGLITTQTSFAQTYGYFEITADLSQVTGAWPAFWLLPADGITTSELDILEHLGQNTDQVSSAVSSSFDDSQFAWHQVADLTEGSHRFGAKWTPYGIDIVIDGIVVAHHATPDAMSKPMYLLANLAMGGYWPGSPDPGAVATYGIDAIRVYQLPEYTLDGYRLLAGAAPVNDVTGTSQAETLTGSNAADRITGGGGADQLFGGLGDDTYVVSDSRAVVTERLGEGIDTIAASVSFALSQNVENLRLTGQGDIDATGHLGANRLVGNAGDNLIRGGGGNDVLIGRGGHDTFAMETGDGSDVIMDFSAGPGAGDVVSLDGYWFTSFADIRGAMTQHGADVHVRLDHLETLVFRDHRIADFVAGDFRLPAAPSLGAEPVRFVPTVEAGDTVYGTPLAERLFDGYGMSTLIGGLGDDTYFVVPGTEVVEAALGGIDTVETWGWWYTLTANVENLRLYSANAQGTGNALANRLLGNDGNETLDGKGGNDWLTGGAGQDSFVFSTAPNASRNRDTIADFAVSEDRIVLDRQAFAGIGPAGGLSGDAFQLGNAANSSGDRIVYDAASGALSFDADGLGGTAAVLFAKVTPGLALTHQDFVIV